MPTTKQLVNWILPNAIGWTRDGVKGVLPLLNEAQNLLCQNESAQNVYYDAATGNLPALTTAAGTFEYSLPSNIWRCSQIVLKADIRYDYDRLYRRHYALDFRDYQPPEQVFYNGVPYIRYPYVRTVDRKSSAAPVKVRFFEDDPGTHTDWYRWIGYVMPTQIETESIQPTIAEKFHLSHLMRATLLLIKAFEFGDWENAMSVIRNELAPEIAAEDYRGEQGMSGFVDRREI